MRAVELFRVALFALLLFSPRRAALAQDSFGRPSPEPPNEDRYVYKQITDIPITTESGVENVSTIWREKPVLLTMAFSRCARACSPFLRSLSAAIADAGGPVVLSFDPRDTVAQMEMMGGELGVKSNPDWIFGVAIPRDIRRLAAVTGFWFQWEESGR
jgi:cytochrome oxidase Cu insertion factor (SCO1/SenC/PrrC family)